MKVKTEQEILEYRKFLYEDEYPDGNLPDNLLYPKPLSKQDIEDECKFARNHGFKYFSYCPNCHDSWIGARGLNNNTPQLHLCPICNYDKVEVYNVNTCNQI